MNIGSAANDLANWGGLVVKGSSGAGSTIANLATNQTFASATVIGGTLNVPAGVTLDGPHDRQHGGHPRRVRHGGRGRHRQFRREDRPRGKPRHPDGHRERHLLAGSTYSVDLNGNTPGNGATNHDQLVLNGTGVTLTLGNATLAGTFGYTPANTDKLYVISLTNATSTVSGTFNGVPQNGTINLGGQFSAQVSYSGDVATSALTGGNDVVLYNFTPVPEPVAVLGFAAAGLAGFGRPRRTIRRHLGHAVHAARAHGGELGKAQPPQLVPVVRVTAPPYGRTDATARATIDAHAPPPCPPRPRRAARAGAGLGRWLDSCRPPHSTC